MKKSIIISLIKTKIKKDIQKSLNEKFKIKDLIVQNKLLDFFAPRSLIFKKRSKHLLKKLYTSVHNPILIKKQFKLFLNKNNLYQIFNLKRDLLYPNYLQSKVEHSVTFRDLVNKEAAYYQAIKQDPLVILISPKPKNIYITIYILSKYGYKILWKKTTGMLQKVEGQLHFAAFIETINKINIFLTKNYLKLKNPLKLIVKSSKYYATKHLIRSFVKLCENNLNLNNIYFMYKYRKRFNFFSNYANLINDSIFNYLSGIWKKFLKLTRRTKIDSRYFYGQKSFDAYNKFFGLEFDDRKRQYTTDYQTRLRRLRRIQTGEFFSKKNIIH